MLIIKYLTGKYRFALAALLLLSLHCFPGQAQDFRFLHLTADEGLSHNAVNGIVKDSQGFIWFATEEGMNRYDGYEVRVYRQKTGDSLSLSHDNVRDVLEDRNGFLWAATYSGLNRYDRSSDRFQRFYIEAQNDVPEIILNSFSSLTEGRNGQVFAGLMGGGIAVFDAQSEKLELMFTENAPENWGNFSVNDITEDAVGRLWVATEGGGLYVSNSEKTRIRPLSDLMDETPNDSHILCLFSDGARMWAGTENGGLLNIFAAENRYERFRHSSEPGALSADAVWTITRDNSGRLWVGTDGGGLNLYFPGSQTFKKYVSDKTNPYSLNSKVIRCIYEDNTEMLWVGTFSGGVNYFDNQGINFHTLRPEGFQGEARSGASITAPYERKNGDIWMATDGRGIAVRKKNTGKITYFHAGQNRGLKVNEVLCLLEDSQSRMWVGTYAGDMYLFDDKTERFRHFPVRESEKDRGGKDVWSITEDKNGFLWPATSNGLKRIDTKTFAVKSFYQSSQESGNQSVNDLRSTLVDSRGNVWVGTFGGLFIFDPKTEKFTKVKTGTEQFSAGLSFTETADGRIWAGTYGDGIYICSADGRVEQHLTEGLPNKTVYSLAEDDNGRAWAGTNRGISRIDLKNNAYKNFAKSDGLQGQQFNLGSVFRNSAGRMFFGGLHGLNIFHPDSIRENERIPTVQLTDFELFNKLVRPAEKGSVLRKHISQTEHLVLDYTDYVFSFRFTALSFRQADKNSYSYQLEGFDKNPIAAGHRRYATYTNIPPGTYTFRVKASNNDGVWNETGTSLKITITPPWWKTKPFMVLAVLAFIGLLVFYIRYREEKLQKDKAVLERKVSERTAEILKQQQAIEIQNEELMQSREEVLAQRDFIEEKNRQLQEQSTKTTDSIRYALDIQLSLLPFTDRLQDTVSDHFIIYRPKDIVSGDFYWLFKDDDCALLALIDCTGHGVPGAFMSVLAYALLNETVMEKGYRDPAEILEYLDIKIHRALKKERQKNTDGFDIGLVYLDKKEDETALKFAGAWESLYVAANGEMTEIKGVRRSIGGRQKRKFFQTETVKIPTEPATFYMASDGLADQNNPGRDKFGSVRFKELLLSVSDLPMAEQKQKIEEATDNFRLSSEQRDDISVIGFRI